MAKVRNNIIIRGLSGDLGKQLRIRTGKISGRTNVFAIADFGTAREDSPAQAAHKQAIREAAAYAYANKENPIYVTIAKGKERQAKNVAMTDWFHPPRILEIDLRGWRGAAGQVIRVLAVDDVKVGQVHVEIADGAGTILETGQAALAVTQRWEYPLQQAHSGSVTVTVFARDLPGHVTQESASKKLPG
jgi:hypothetical protein